RALELAAEDEVASLQLRDMDDAQGDRQGGAALGGEVAVEHRAGLERLVEEQADAAGGDVPDQTQALALACNELQTQEGAEGGLPARGAAAFGGRDGDSHQASLEMKQASSIGCHAHGFAWAWLQHAHAKPWAWHPFITYAGARSRQAPLAEGLVGAA